VPVRLIGVGEFVALLTTETLPETLAEAVGENATVIEAVCPAARVKGNAMPAAVKPVPAVVN
jgi:hypothetical protein